MGACAAVMASVGWLPLRASAADPLGSQEFATMLGDRFHMAGYNGTDGGVVKLIAVDEVDADPALDQFHLRFRGRRGVRLAEGIYAVTNWNGHPNFDLHVRPTHVNRRGRELYIASFARFR